MHHLHAVGPQTVIAVTDALEAAQSAQIEIGERAGIEARRRLDQRHLHFGGELTQIAGRRGAPKAAAHHHHMGRGRPGAHECRHGQHGSPGGQHLSATGPESLIRLHLDIAIPSGQGGVEGIGQEASAVGCRGLSSAGHCAAGAPGLLRPMSGRCVLFRVCCRVPSAACRYCNRPIPRIRPAAEAPPFTGPTPVLSIVPFVSFCDEFSLRIIGIPCLKR